jgi:hypothetical protein
MLNSFCKSAQRASKAVNNIKRNAAVVDFFCKLADVRTRIVGPEMTICKSTYINLKKTQSLESTDFFAL